MSALTPKYFLQYACTDPMRNSDSVIDNIDYIGCSSASQTSHSATPMLCTVYAKNTIYWCTGLTSLIFIHMPFWVISTSFKHAHCSANGGINILCQDFRPGCVEKICKWSKRATENAKFQLFSRTFQLSSKNSYFLIAIPTVQIFLEIFAGQSE